jgi:preprotein translocase subunit SecA
MAGRGTDIILGGNPEAMAWAQLQEKYATRLDVPQDEWDALVAEIEKREQTRPEGREVAAMGGLHVIGTERHEARRIDLQLRGRCGRQGDPGSSRFYLSLEDDLMRIFAGEWVKNVLTRLGMEEGQAIESRMVTRRIEGAQKKVEERNFEIRKNLLEYDEVMDEQRKRVYSYRQKILDGADCKELILENIQEEVEYHLDQFLAKDYGTESFSGWASKQLAVEFEARDFRDMDFETAERYAKDQAERRAEGQVFDLVEENLPEDVDQGEWNWEALAKGVNVRWRLSLRDRELKKIGRDGVAETLIEKAHESIHKVDLSGGAHFLEPGFGLKTVCAWVRHKFGIELDLAEVQDLEISEFKDQILQRAESMYGQKEVEFPVMAGLYHFTTRDASGHKRYDREKLVDWAKDRFGVELSLEDLKNKQRHEIRELLVAQSHQAADQARQKMEEGRRWLDQVFDGRPEANESVRGNGHLESLSQWLKKELRYDLPPDKIGDMERGELERCLIVAVDERFRPEMCKMERTLLLQILDQAWKDHLLVMDHLRSSVGLRGYAQVDPKVEFKREGMRLFERMWRSVGQRVTDLIFRMEQLDEGFIGSTWTESEAIHEEAPSTSEIVDQQQAAIDGTQADKKPQPIRRREERVGRNDPCPCGSGKKYKRCCGRTAA